MSRNKFYYLVVSYDTVDMAMADDSKLFGPFKTKPARKKALIKDLEGRDLEDKSMHVSYLETHPEYINMFAEMIKTKSFVTNTTSQWREKA